MTSQTKTDAQRAQDALDVANRQLERTVYRRNSLRVQLKTAEDDVTAAKARRDYAALNPALKPATEVTSSGQPQTVPGGDE